MKLLWFFILFLFIYNTYGQPVSSVDKNFSHRNDAFHKIIPDVKNYELTPDSGTSNHAAINNLKYNSNGRLKNDIPEYNTKSPLWVPAAYIVGTNIFIWAADRLVLDKDYADISPKTWSKNLQTGWEWDDDRYAANFFGHPYSGGLFFNAARSNGYNYFQSIPFVIGGCLIWEYFGESQPVSKSDVITTTVNGPFFGEVLYRISSNILDDRTTGSERVFREIAAGLINPVRGLDRLFDGKTKRVITGDIYQKEPLNVTIYSGMHRVNTGTGFNAVHTDAFFNITLNYGNPFEDRFRKPFDLFRLETDITMGAGRRFFDDVTGYGILFGKNVRLENPEMLIGIFQHYEYRNNKTVELSSFAISGGVISELHLYNETALYTNLFLGAIPLGANSTHIGTYDTEFRDYNYGGGMEGIIESKIDFGSRLNIFFRGYYYWIHTYHGYAGDNFIGIIRTGFVFRIFNNLHAGAEHYIYFNERNSANFPDIHLSKSEQKIFLLYNFD